VRAGGYMDDPEITGEQEIDIGLRRRPLREPFLIGPILLSELARIAQMPGKALAVLLLIRHPSDLSRGDWITLPRTVLEKWGIRKDSKAEALRRLEDAGLIPPSIAASTSYREISVIGRLPHRRTKTLRIARPTSGPLRCFGRFSS